MAEYGLSRKHQSGLDTETTQAISASAGYWLTGESTPFNRREAAYGVPGPLHQYGAVQVGFRYNRLQNLDHGNVARRARLGYPSCRTAGITANVTDCKLDQYQLVLNYYPNPRLRFAGQITKAVADLGDAGKDKPMKYELRVQFQF